MEMQSLASCALERLGKKHGKIQKTDFPDRYMVRLRRETDSVTLWDVDLIAVDQESTRVAIASRRKLKTCSRTSYSLTSILARCRRLAGRGFRDDLQPSLFSVGARSYRGTRQPP
jgi:hypothetical protein